MSFFMFVDIKMVVWEKKFFLNNFGEIRMGGVLLDIQR